MTQVTQPSVLQVWILAARPKTLWAGIVPVILGTAMAVEAGAFHAGAAVTALLCAVLIQVGTNFNNDYADFIKGADTDERIGPLRVTQAGLIAPETLKRASYLVLALAFLAGMYLVFRGGWPILLVGVLSIVSGILYTTGTYSLAYMGLGDLFVLVFFGPVAVGGTFFVQALRLELPVFLVGIGAGLLSVAILLANNIRDVEADVKALKRTLVVRLGHTFGVTMYTLCFIGAALVAGIVYLITGRHPWILASMIVLPLAFPAIRTLHVARDQARLNPVLGLTARLLLLYGLLFSIGWNL